MVDDDSSEPPRHNPIGLDVLVALAISAYVYVTWRGGPQSVTSLLIAVLGGGALGAASIALESDPRVRERTGNTSILLVTVALAFLAGLLVFTRRLPAWATIGLLALAWVGVLARGVAVRREGV